jgi:hypothetical protein
MRHDRRGLTVIELVLILLAVGLIIFFLFRLRGRDDAAPVVPPAADSAVLPPTAAAPLVDRLDLATPIDTVAAPGDTIVVRFRATGAGAGVARATIDLAPGPNSVVLPASLVTNDIGEASAQWIVAAADSADSSAGATRTLRATVRGNPSATLETSVRVAPAGVPDAR